MKRNFLFYIALFIVLSHFKFGSCIWYTTQIGNIVSLLIIGLLVGTFLLKPQYAISDQTFRKEVLLFAIIPFFSSITCYLYRNQPILNTIVASRGALMWFFYFFLHRHHFSIKETEKLLIISGIYIGLLYIFQQVVYPSIAWFGVMSDENGDGEVFQRNGLWRFYINGVLLLLISCFIYAGRFFKTIKWRNLYIMLFFFIAIYLTLTRQLMLATIVSFLLVPFLSHQNIKAKWAMISLIVLGTILGGSVFYDDLLGGMVEDSQNDINNSDYVRFAAWRYFGLEYWEDGFNMLLGNGRESIGNSEYGNFIQNLKLHYHLYRSDIGIVGTFSMYGILYMMVVLVAYVKIFRQLKYCPTYLYMTIIASLVTIIMISWVDSVIFGLILYLIDGYKTKTRGRNITTNIF